MKSFLIILLIASSPATKYSNTVYVCGNKSLKYHLTLQCRGLSSCKQRIVKMTLESAKKSGRTICNWEK